MNFKSSMLRSCEHWYYLFTGPKSGKFNMAYDAYLLDMLGLGVLENPILRIYGWNEMTISLGKNQNVSGIPNYQYPCVKRITGGQSVLHGGISDEITYSVVLYHGSKFKDLYHQIGEALINFLSSFGLCASFGYKDNCYTNSFDCFNSKTSADIVVQDIKVIGSAQCRKRGNILQHGSIRLDVINNLCGKTISFKEAEKALKESFSKYFKIRFIQYPYFQQDCEKIESANGKFVKR